MTDRPTCKAALNIAGEHFPCQQMDHMAAGNENHNGWAHSNRDAEAIWRGDEGDGGNVQESRETEPTTQPSGEAVARA